MEERFTQAHLFSHVHHITAMYTMLLLFARVQLLSFSPSGQLKVAEDHLYSNWSLLPLLTSKDLTLY